MLSNLRQSFLLFISLPTEEKQTKNEAIIILITMAFHRGGKKHVCHEQDVENMKQAALDAAASLYEEYGTQSPKVSWQCI